MVQALFMVVFVSVVLPVLFQLYREGDRLEAALKGYGLVGRTIIAISMLLSGLSVAGYIDGWTWVKFLDSTLSHLLFRIPIHETGHFIFMPVGRIISIFGGSFNEVALPFVCGCYFLIRQQPHLGTIFLFLAGRSLVDVGQYMSSAEKPDSVLILGFEQGAASHDWYNLFTWAGLLKSAGPIAHYTQMFGFGIMALSVILLFILTDNSSSEEEGGRDSLEKPV